MRKGFLILSAALLVLISCYGNRGGVWIYRADERGDVDIAGGRAGVIRTVYCDIYIEHLSRDLYRGVTDSDSYRGSGKGMPVETCFQFLVVNTWNRPLVIEKITLRYDNADHEPEFFDYIKDKDYAEKRFAVNLNSMRQNRRLLTDAEIIKEIDYDTDTVEYRSDFIAPGDRVLFFRFFPLIPHRKGVKVSITIKYFDMKKIIDFDIIRSEYTEE